MASDIENITTQINALADMLSPNAEFSADAITRGGISITANLDAANNSINEVFDRQLTIQENFVVKEAAKELISDVLGVAVNICKFCVSLTPPTDPIGAVAAGWKIIDGVFTTGQDAVAIATVGIGLGLAGTSLGDNRTRYAAVNEADRQRQKKGIASELEEAGLDGLANAARVANVAADAYGLYKGVTGAYESVTEISKIASSDILTTGTKTQIILSEYAPGLLGADHMDYGTGTTLGMFKQQKGVISTVKSGYDLITNLTDPDTPLAEYFMDNNDFTKIGKSTSKMIEDEIEAIEKIISGGEAPLPDGGGGGSW